MKLTFLTLFCFFAFLTSAFGGEETILHVIPRPMEAKPGEGQFVISSSTPILVDKDDEPSRQAAEYLADFLAGPLGAKPPIRAGGHGEPGEGAIELARKGAPADLGKEGYELAATPHGIVIRAPEGTGLFYGIQTLRQLLPPEIERREKVDGFVWNVPAVTIKDKPRYAWRGMMLDVARHFYTKQEVERFLDLMALHKLNVFHWHLTDDQGWRIEIKKYPKLTEVGAWRDGVGFGLDAKSTERYDKAGRYGGFYTQDDIREVVAHAAALHITILPEIEMPGHSSAALAAYPQFSCSKKPGKIPTKGGVMTGIYCPGNDASFTFIEDVLSEVIPLFPGTYIHVGGDEVPKHNWHECDACQARMKAEGLKNEEELQSYFIKRIEKFLATKNRHLIGWDEILEGGLAPGADVMSWRGMNGGTAAAKSGHDVVMSPNSFVYFDHYQTHIPGTPKAIGGFLTLQMVYNFEPTPDKLTPGQAAHILGPQANLWTEYVANIAHVEYMTYPRACALAEVGWSPKDSRNWTDFCQRLHPHFARLKELGVHYYDALTNDKPGK